MENDFQMLLTQHFEILSLASLVFFLMFLVAWKNGYFSFPRKGLQAETKLSSQAFFGAFGIFLLLQLLIIPLSFQFWYYFYTLGEEHFTRSEEMSGWVSVYGIIMSTVGMSLYFFSLSSQNKDIILGPYAHRGFYAKFQDFFIACFTWILSYPLVVMVGQFIAIILLLVYQNVEVEQVAVNQIRTASSSTVLLVTLIICVIALVPFIEELLFRGFLQNWLKRFMRTSNAILVTSCIFALFHFSPSQGMGNIELIISLFILACFLGFVYERQKSLWASVSLHAIFNAISVMLIFYVEKEGIP